MAPGECHPGDGLSHSPDFPAKLVVGDATSEDPDSPVGFVGSTVQIVAQKRPNPLAGFSCSHRVVVVYFTYSPSLVVDRLLQFQEGLPLKGSPAMVLLLVELLPGLRHARRYVLGLLVQFGVYPEPIP